MRKSKVQRQWIRASGIRFPFLWRIVYENGHFLHVRCRLTGENRIITK